MLGVYLSPKYATDQNVYLAYSEPGVSGRRRSCLEPGPGPSQTWSSRAARRAWRVSRSSGGRCRRGRGGQFGAAIAFSPDGQYLFLTVGDRHAHDPCSRIRTRSLARSCGLTRWQAGTGQSRCGKMGAKQVTLITAEYRHGRRWATAPGAEKTYTYPGTNPTPSEVWSSGHRTPYGLAFAPDGKPGRSSMVPRAAMSSISSCRPKNLWLAGGLLLTSYNDVLNPSHDSRPESSRSRNSTGTRSSRQAISLSTTAPCSRDGRVPP